MDTLPNRRKPKVSPETKELEEIFRKNDAPLFVFEGKNDCLLLGLLFLLLAAFLSAILIFSH